MKKILISAVILILLSASVFAFNGYVIVTNDTGYDIYFLYISHENAEDWGEDVLASDQILSDGESFRYDVAKAPTAVFDIMAEDEDGDSYTRWGVDIEFEDVTFTLEDLDM